ncbi:MAG: hypothetical protein GY853_11115 [PVC group bacterium]|nr:hypothetical protein [PVC group bacterium]
MNDIKRTENAMIRVWKEMDINEIKKHMLSAGELSANCDNCQQLGIDFMKEPICPNCGTGFKYITFRKKDSKREELFAIGRINKNRPDLIILDYEDIKRACGKSKAQDIFG